VTALRRALLAAFILGLGFSITLSETSLALLTVLWLARFSDRESGRARIWPLAAPVLCWTGVSVLSALGSGHPGASLAASRELLLVLALYVTVDALPDVGAADRFLSGLAVVAAAAAAMGILQVGLCPVAPPDQRLTRWFFHRCDRARGAFSIYMTLAGVLNLTLLATLPRLLSTRPDRRWSVPAWLLTLGGLAATLTRGAWVGFGCGVLAFLPTTRKGRLLLIGGLLALALGALAGPAHLRQRVLSMGDPDDPTLKEREYMWRSGLAMWQQHPWRGFGPGGVKREYRHYALAEAVKKRTGHLHNTPLQILVERGLIGLGAWIWIWAQFYARTVGLLRRLPSGAEREWTLVAGSLAAVTGFLVNGLSEYNFGDSEVILVAWAIMALPFVVERHVRVHAVTGDAAPTSQRESRRQRPSPPS
jgi:putative inorganic carbon (hco3(-)) transporter